MNDELKVDIECTARTVLEAAKHAGLPDPCPHCDPEVGWMCPDCGLRMYASDLARFYLAELAERKRIEAERELPVTVEWLLDIGGLPDDSQAGDVSFRIYYLEPADRGTFLDGEFTRVVFCVDGSACAECYDEHGISLEVVGVGFYRTRGQVLDLLKALGVKP